jgi:hypothetical protein
MNFAGGAQHALRQRKFTVFDLGTVLAVLVTLLWRAALKRACYRLFRRGANPVNGGSGLIPAQPLQQRMPHDCSRTGKEHRPHLLQRSPCSTQLDKSLENRVLRRVDLGRRVASDHEAPALPLRTLLRSKPEQHIDLAFGALPLP